jgi:myo-inositol-1(or 4)-monophosphatase
MSFCKNAIEEIKSQLDKILDLRSQKAKKEDGSYVSKGDLLVQDIIFGLCETQLPNHYLISEELAPFDNAEWDDQGSYIFLDPIDGTENFVSGLREWGVGISIYTNGKHQESCIYLPELNDFLVSGQKLIKFKSRIHGLSSSLTKHDLIKLKEGYEYRIMGCSMYNMLNAIRGSYARFENINGVHCWDIIPGLNLALEFEVKALVDDKLYQGQILFPNKKYKIRLEASE